MPKSILNVWEKSCVVWFFYRGGDGMGSFRKEFSEEKNFTLLSLYFFPSSLPSPAPFCLFCSMITIIFVSLMYLPLSLIFICFFVSITLDKFVSFHLIMFNLLKCHAWIFSHRFNTFKASVILFKILYSLPASCNFEVYLFLPPPIDYNLNALVLQHQCSSLPFFKASVIWFHLLILRNHSFYSKSNYKITTIFFPSCFCSNEKLLVPVRRISTLVIRN